MVVDSILVLILQLPVSVTVGVVRGMFGIARNLQNPQQVAEAGPIFWISMAFEWLMSLMFTIGYFGYFYSAKGATPGKMIFGLRVIDRRTGAHLSFGRAALRETVGKGVSMLTFLIGYLMAAFRSDKRALHDLMVDSQVVRQIKRT